MPLLSAAQISSVTDTNKRVGLLIHSLFVYIHRKRRKVTDMNTEIYADMKRIKAALLCYQQETERIRRMNRSISTDSPFVISFVGRFKTGKSSLLNALLGAEILPTRASTATSVITRIFRGNATQAWFVENGHRQQITLETAQNIILNYRVKDVDHPGEVIIELPISWLSRDVELRDTPGMDDSAQNGYLDKIVLNALDDTDLCICVFDASAMISAKERERTRKIHSRMAGNVVYAVNCTNRLNSIKQLQEVDDLCSKFYGTLQQDTNAMDGMGKYYLMCSAPKMIDLDGFDVWLREIVAGQSAGKRLSIRKSSWKGLWREKASQINVSILQQEKLLRGYYETLGTQQAGIRVDLRAKADEILAEKEARLRNVVPQILDVLNDVGTLETRLKRCTTSEGWQNCYSTASRDVAKEMFLDNWKKARRDTGESFFREIDDQFINDAFSVLTFPGHATIAVPATKEERVSGTVIGTGIGMLFGPIGALVGGALGHAVGASDTMEEYSIPNTVAYIKRDVIPALRSAFENTVREKLKEQRNTEMNRVNSASTGLESLLLDVKCLITELNYFSMGLNLVDGEQVFI